MINLNKRQTKRLDNIINGELHFLMSDIVRIERDYSVNFFDGSMTTGTDNIRKEIGKLNKEIDNYKKIISKKEKESDDDIAKLNIYNKELSNLINQFRNEQYIESYNLIMMYIGIDKNSYEDFEEEYPDLFDVEEMDNVTNLIINAFITKFTPKNNNDDDGDSDFVVGK